MMIKSWNTLYKTTSKNKEQRWDISVIQKDSSLTRYIVTVYGQTDGKRQSTEVEISVGKNIGKSNETTPEQQAISEASSKWDKQRDKGYSEERGGTSMDLRPMLAHKYDDNKGKVDFSEAFCSPKLDGCRSIAVRTGQEVTLTSRGNKKFEGLDHIKQALLELMEDGEVWDGELYNHDIKFQKIMSLIKDSSQEDSKLVEYHVYDSIKPLSFSERFNPIYGKLMLADGPVRPVEAVPVSSHAEIKEYHERAVGAGFEGCMVRYGKEPYKAGYRSQNLLKVKHFDDAEYLITGVEAGIGKCANQGIFICVTAQGKEFRAKIEGADELREHCLLEPAAYIGKMLTVKYFGLTEDSIPRFPVGIKKG